MQRTILLIEDHPSVREIVETILKLANYKVILATNGKEGVELALTHPPDLIVCDVNMPELDGYGVLHMVQKHFSTRNIPFIFMTSLGERGEMRKGMDLGADDYLVKPFTNTELLNAIAGRLQKASGHVNSAAAIQEKTLQPEEQDIYKTFEEQQEIQQYQKKQLIYREGRQGHRLYLVKTGKVKIFKTNDDGKDLITHICAPGEFFGYQSLLANAATQESAEALENSEIASIAKETFNKLIYSDSVMKEFLKLLAGNVREKEAQLLILAYNSLRKKVATTLIMLKSKYHLADVNPTIISLSRENMAAIYGIARESLIRTLGDFRDEGLIDIKGNDIIVLQEEKLLNLLN